MLLIICKKTVLAKGGNDKLVWPEDQLVNGNYLCGYIQAKESLKQLAVRLLVLDRLFWLFQKLLIFLESPTIIYRVYREVIREWSNFKLHSLPEYCCSYVHPFMITAYLSSDGFFQQKNAFYSFSKILI